MTVSNRGAKPSATWIRLGFQEVEYVLLLHRRAGSAPLSRPLRRDAARREPACRAGSTG